MAHFSQNLLTSFQTSQTAYYKMSNSKHMNEKEPANDVVGIDLKSVEAVTSTSQQLHRKLRSKEVQLFAIGGAIGTCKFLSLVINNLSPNSIRTPERKLRLKARWLIHDNSPLCANGKCTSERWPCRLIHRLHHLVNSYVSG